MPTDHPTEEQARRLLARAAATIEVDETAPLTLTGLPEPERRRWPVLLAAAAAVLVAVAGGAVVARQLGDEELAPEPASTPTATAPPPTTTATTPADITTEELARQLDLMAVGGVFAAWARGEGRTPEFADRVRVMFGGGAAFGHPGWTEEPEDRGSYAGCSGLGFPDCGLDPVGLLASFEGDVLPTPGRARCAGRDEVPPRYAEAADDVVSLQEAPDSCGWAVELWVDDRGSVYAVNLSGVPLD